MKNNLLVDNMKKWTTICLDLLLFKCHT